MKKRLIPLLLCVAALTGCSGNTQSDASLPPLDSMIAEETQPATEKTYAGLIYYVTDHGTVDAAGMTSWKADLETMGNTWKSDVLASVPAASDTILVLNAPTEDITQNDLNALDALFDAGGHMLLVMPANASEVRYKYIERALEEFCIRMDYDLVTDPAEGHTAENNAVLMTRIGTPDGMSLDEKYYSAPLMLDNARSFSFFYNEGYGSIKMDGFLETDITAIGTPCGGTEDDPETFEGTTLKTMLYARDEQRLNASVVAVGSGSFLTDAKYSDPLSEQPLGWVTATVPWMIWLNNRD